MHAQCKQAGAWTDAAEGLETELMSAVSALMTLLIMADMPRYTPPACYPRTASCEVCYTDSLYRTEGASSLNHDSMCLRQPILAQRVVKLVGWHEFKPGCKSA